MSQIVGIGDEVTHFFAGILVTILGCLAWWSTRTSEQRHLQTVLLLERTRRRQRGRLTNHTHSLSLTEEEPTAIQSVVNEFESGVNSSLDSIEQEQVEIVEQMDAGDRPLDADGKSRIEKKPHAAVAANVPLNEDGSRADEIRIKLKYLNDDQQLVNGYLQEPLGSFKQRHLQGEMYANKNVRLIFNGQVLRQDDVTLANCGLFDNCVVHCLIHQRQPQQQSQGHEQGGNINDAPPRVFDVPEGFEGFHTVFNHNNALHNNAAHVREWDLTNLLFALITFAIATAWYIRFVCAHLYSFVATVGLILLTGLFSFFLAGYISPYLNALGIALPRDGVQRVH